MDGRGGDKQALWDIDVAQQRTELSWASKWVASGTHAMQTGTAIFSRLPKWVTFEVLGPHTAIPQSGQGWLQLPLMSFKASPHQGQSVSL